MSKVFWDTNLFIYLIEDSDARAGRVAQLYERMRERGDVLFTSALTLGEVLVKPLERGDEEFQARFERAIVAGASVLPFDTSAARHFASIRADRSIRAPDAMQLACAASAGMDLFITNDDRLSRKVVRGIQFIQPLSRAFL